MVPTAVTNLDVLIVGAGPVGLFLANECARRSLRWRIVEQRGSQSEHSKALAIFPRTLEIFDMAGVVAPFLDVANRVTAVAVVVHGRRLAHIPFAPAGTPYPFVAMVPQDVTERLLVEALQGRGGTVQYDTSFVSAVQGDDGVAVTLERRGQPITLTAAFVVGCDGAHSAVRHLLNLSFAGAQYEAMFMLADVDTNEALPDDELQLCPHEGGPLAIFPMSRTRRRIVATVDAALDDAPTLGIVNALLRQRAPQGIEAHALRWSTYFRVHHRQVAQLRAGRIFVAGDAAHIHSPFGGQGMNTGLQDVWNLAWKLELAVRGRAQEALLDSYTEERRPVIRKVIRTTDLITKAMGTRGRIAQGLRDLVIPVVSRLAPFQRRFVQRLSQLGVAYRGGLIVRGAGRRYFGGSLRGGRGIGSRFLLFIDTNMDSPTVLEAKSLAVDMHDILEMRAAPHQGIVLVRPDGYTAYESRRDPTPSALRAMREVLERQVVSAGRGGRLVSS
jgi:2-polyprenyl-6-methoxyphenol hydroxylase-like FAD-dependent oxidoreductase